MQGYKIRKATINDAAFLAEGIIAAEKSNSGKLTYSTLFNLSEEKVKDLIIAMFEEEINGCEFSISSYLVTEYEGNPIALLGAWIESFYGNIPSKILKSNLIGFTFGREPIKCLKEKALIIRDILIEREPMTLQFEYLFVVRNHHKKGVAEGLIKKHISNALLAYPKLKKGQGQVFKNNLASIKVIEKLGFQLANTFKSSHNEIFDYLSYNEKLLMELKIT